MNMYIFQIQKTLIFSFACFSSNSQSLLIAVSYVVFLDRSLRQDTSKPTELLGAFAIFL